MCYCTIILPTAILNEPIMADSTTCTNERKKNKLIRNQRLRNAETVFLYKVFKNLFIYVQIEKKVTNRNLFLIVLPQFTQKYLVIFFPIPPIFT